MIYINYIAMLNKELRQFDNMLKVITWVSLGNDLFVPFLEMLGSVNEQSEKYKSLEENAIKGLGLEIVGGMVHTDDPELRKKLNSVIDELASKDVKIETVVLTMPQYIDLAKENNRLQGGDLLLLKKLLVK